MLDDLGRRAPDDLRESRLRPPSTDPDRMLVGRLPRFEPIERLLHRASVASPRRASPFVIHRTELFCSAYGGSSFVVCQPDGDTQRMIASELFAGDAAAAAGSSAIALGTFRFDSTLWPGCAKCGAKHSLVHGIGPFWHCECRECEGRPFQCVGSSRDDGRFRAACGRLVGGPFLVETFIATRGWTSVPNAIAPSGSTMRGEPK